jgi:hypothetical protein
MFRFLLPEELEENGTFRKWIEEVNMNYKESISKRPSLA